MKYIGLWVWLYLKSLAAPSPQSWAAEVTWLYHEKKADRVLGEDNYGGDMVERCLNCGSTAIVKRGPITHCNSCSSEWGGSKSEPVPGRKMLK